MTSLSWSGRVVCCLLNNAMTQEIELTRRKIRGVPVHTQEILRYFLRNPQAVDSLEGIARWRLMDERIHRDVEEIRQALRGLVARRLLVEESVPGAAPVFRLNKEEVQAAKALLAKDEGRPVRRKR